jgi:hypothetical protein
LSLIGLSLGPESSWLSVCFLFRLPEAQAFSSVVAVFRQNKSAERCLGAMVLWRSVLPCWLLKLACHAGIMIGIRLFDRRRQADAALLWRGCHFPGKPPGQPVCAELKDLIFGHLYPFVAC